MPKGKEADRWDVERLGILCFVDRFIPEITESLLQLWESAPYVKFSNRFEGLRSRARSVHPTFPGIDPDEIPCGVDAVGEQHTIAVCQIIPKDRS